jgi:hypothetical protein
MEFARNTQNNSLYSAQQFERTPSDELSENRQHLACPECGEPAFFRRETHNGREPCFGARPHAQGCSQSAGQATHPASQQQDIYSEFMDPAVRLVVDFAYGAASAGNWIDPQEGHQDFNNQSLGATGSGGQTDRVQHVRLRPLLRLLMSGAPLHATRKVVDVQGIGRFPVADLFVPFANIAAMRGKDLCGVFGKVATADFDPCGQTLWLNCAGWAEPSICIDWKHIPELFSRFGIKDIKELAGADVLAFGSVRASRNGKHYVVPVHNSQIAFDLMGR